ncbi:MAG: hypothetical protein JW791_05025 [Nanoarchaeota archaeon]|nr:hypothetical protein [Nanoarchaeota archaeon]
MERKNVKKINIFITADTLYENSKVLPDLNSVLYTLKIQEEGEENSFSRRVDSIGELDNALVKYTADECISDIQGIVTGLVRLAKELDVVTEQKGGWFRLTEGMSKYYRTLSRTEIETIKKESSLEFTIKPYSLDAEENCE